MVARGVSVYGVLLDLRQAIHSLPERDQETCIFCLSRVPPLLCKSSVGVDSNPVPLVGCALPS